MYYMQVEVLQPNFYKLKQSLRSVKTIDEVMTHHANFLDECLKQCLLTDQHLFKIITQINIRTLFFSRVIIRFFNNVRDEETLDGFKPGEGEPENYGEVPYSELPKCEQRKRRNKAESDLIKKNISENNYPKILEQFEDKFNEFMKQLLENLTQSRRYESHIANLAQRLDFNDFYFSRLADAGNIGSIRDLQ